MLFHLAKRPIYLSDVWKWKILPHIQAWFEVQHCCVRVCTISTGVSYGWKTCISWVGGDCHQRFCSICCHGAYKQGYHANSCCHGKWWAYCQKWWTCHCTGSSWGQVCAAYIPQFTIEVFCSGTILFLYALLTGDVVKLHCIVLLFLIKPTTCKLFSHPFS